MRRFMHRESLIALVALGVIVLAIWLELSVSVVLYCAEIVALLIPPKKPPRPAHH